VRDRLCVIIKRSSRCETVSVKIPHAAALPAASPTTRILCAQHTSKIEVVALAVTVTVTVTVAVAVQRTVFVARATAVLAADSFVRPPVDTNGDSELGVPLKIFD